MFSYKDWMEHKSELAQELGKGASGGSYGDGAIILCAAISAMSSLLWPVSRGTDRKRFIEIMVRFSACDQEPTRISGPLLAEELTQLRQFLTIDPPELYLAGDVDKQEALINEECARRSIPECKEQICRYLYASLLYKEVRCAYMHEYEIGKNATERDYHTYKHVSYLNKLWFEGEEAIRRRLIYFPLGWISAVALNVANGMDRECERQNKHPFKNLGLAIPSPCWIDGG